jgi:hypothetical protein
VAVHGVEDDVDADRARGWPPGRGGGGGGRMWVRSRRCGGSGSGARWLVAPTVRRVRGIRLGGNLRHGDPAWAELVASTVGRGGGVRRGGNLRHGLPARAGLVAPTVGQGRRGCVMRTCV